MDLYLVRHAIAEERRPDLPDEERSLTGEGRARFRLVVAGLKALGVRLDRVLHSPWRRAAQTAEELGPLVDGPLVATERLAESPGEALLAQIEGASVALVGHEPWMSELLELLLLGRSGAQLDVSFKKGGVAWLRGDPRPGAAVLRAFLPPRVFRQLSST